MNKIKAIAVTALSALVLTACSNSKEQVEQAPVQELYQKAQDYLQDENYRQAIRYLEATDSRFPYGEYAQQADLNLIYAYYRSEDYVNTLSTADRYLQKYPQGPHLDYVLYLAGLTNMALGDNLFQDFFGVDRSSRETKPREDAYHNFETLVRYFPNSEYTKDAVQRMQYIRESLAKHQYEIAEFYQKRNAYVAVVNRIQDNLLRLYSDTSYAYKALPMLQQAYAELHLDKQADEIGKILANSKEKTFPELVKPESSPDVKPPLK
ncbi:outer membrane protein assembly factor BamD [Gallibacterium melopsittaci]|uniref:Outer membrane protein assembly factor BamD n=1 Tax=Gallibacterium melopsittaci TaxID=516063 RepID=A0ABV6HX24_9PAST